MPKLFDPPRFYSPISMIADDFSLAATACSMIGGEGDYVAVVQGPRMTRPDKEAEIVKKSNGIGRLRPRTVLLIGPEVTTNEVLKERFGRAGCASISALEQLLTLLDPLQRSGLAGEVRCKGSEVGLGLLRAKRECKLLIVDENATPLEAPLDASPTGHVVVLDDHSGLAQVIAANYAYAVGADLILIPERDDSLRKQVYADLDSRSAHRGQPQGERAEQSLQDAQSRIGPVLQFGVRKFVTFITKGLPYGYFYRDAPSTHLFSYPSLGETINAALYWSWVEPFISTTVLIDPGHFADSETPLIGSVLEAEGVNVFSVLDEKATVETTRLFLHCFPYDLLFICSHCREIPGELLKIRIIDPESVPHVIELEEAVQVGSLAFGTKPNHVQIHSVIRPVSIDGTEWEAADPSVRRHFAVFWKHLIEQRGEWDILSRVPVDRVSHSTAIKVADGYLMLSADVIHAHMTPIIFNNSCVSFFDVARTLTFAGARSYIGTLAPVDDTAAKQVAEHIFSGSEREVSLPNALSIAQQTVFADPADRIYVHVGCHFCHLRTPKLFARSLFRQRIANSVAGWEDLISRANADPRERVSEYIKFLSLFAHHTQ